MNQGQLPLVMGLGQLIKGPGHPVAYHHLTAALGSQLLKEFCVVLELSEVGSQGATRMGASGIHHFNAYSDLALVLSLGLLSKGTEHTKLSHCLPGTHRPSRVL